MVSSDLLQFQLLVDYARFWREIIKSVISSFQKFHFSHSEKKIGKLFSYKMIVQPKEFSLFVSIGTFLTNYDVTNRKLKYVVTYSIARKQTEWERHIPMEATILNGKDFWKKTLLRWLNGKSHSMSCITFGA